MMRLITVKAAAERLSVSDKTVYRMVYDGLLTPYPVGTGQTKPRIRIDETELETRIRAQADRSTAVPTGTPAPSYPPADTRPPSGPAQPPKAA